VHLGHGCSEVPAGRTAAVTTLVLSLWQLAGPGMTPTVPSLILLDGSGADADPLDGFAARLGKTERDVLLERLAAEDLVRIEGKTVEAANFAEFVDALYARDEFPEPENHWAALIGNDKGSA
jgi:hypothetical protein